MSKPESREIIFLEYLRLFSIYFCLALFLRCLNIYSFIFLDRARRGYEVWFGLFSLFNGLTTYMGYLMPKPSLLKNSSGTIYNPSLGVRGWVHNFSKEISSKLNVIARLEFEHAFYNVAVQHNVDPHLVWWGVYIFILTFCSVVNLIRWYRDFFNFRKKYAMRLSPLWGIEGYSREKNTWFFFFCVCGGYHIGLRNGYRRGKWIWWDVCKFCLCLFAFHFVLMLFGKTYINLFSQHLI